MWKGRNKEVNKSEGEKRRTVWKGRNKEVNSSEGEKRKRAGEQCGKAEIIIKSWLKYMKMVSWFCFSMAKQLALTCFKNLVLRLRTTIYWRTRLWIVMEQRAALRMEGR